MIYTYPGQNGCSAVLKSCCVYTSQVKSVIDNDGAFPKCFTASDFYNLEVL